MILTVTIDHRTGFFPGSIYLFTFWYMPKELFGRLALFHCASALAGAFSGLLAAGIARMDGVGRQEGWRWIFIIELLATVILGVSSFFLLTPRKPQGDGSSPRRSDTSNSNTSSRKVATSRTKRRRFRGIISRRRC